MQRIAVVLEPDSLSNLVTNLDRPRCKTAEGIYKRGIAYAISKLSLPNVFLYLEAAHAGWLGFPKNIDRAAALYKNVLTMAGGPDRVRGFALNVSNYDPAVDPAKTPTRSDLRRQRRARLRRRPDQGRSPVSASPARASSSTPAATARAYIRSIASSWCNVKGAGLGERPRAAPSPLIDAYLYVKVPGESDGTSDPNAPRFDQTCASEDATPGAPQAGKMFDAVPHRAPQERQPAALRGGDVRPADHV